MTVLRLDQYYTGYTMRFPRALQIRDDLSIGDCMSASGTCLVCEKEKLQIFATIAILDGIRSEKKRKMESGAGYVSTRFD